MRLRHSCYVSPWIISLQICHPANTYAQLSHSSTVEHPDTDFNSSPKYQQKNVYETQVAIKSDQPVDDKEKSVLLPPPSYANNDNNDDKLAANAVVSAGRILQSSNKSQAALDYTKGVMASAASGKIEEYLRRYGNAKVDLNLDENFSLKESGAEVLIPLYDSNSDLLFTQFSFHHNDDMYQFNSGIGL